eukprot:m.293939 g.293939  ORF g.293939 m.293939 type:complete len:137 (+) comp22962_c0_seq7:1432-1842(+)
MTDAVAPSLVNMLKANSRLAELAMSPADFKSNKELLSAAAIKSLTTTAPRCRVKVLGRAAQAETAAEIVARVVAKDTGMTFLNLESTMRLSDDQQATLAANLVFSTSITTSALPPLFTHCEQHFPRLPAHSVSQVA